MINEIALRIFALNYRSLNLPSPWYSLSF